MLPESKTSEKRNSQDLLASCFLFLAAFGLALKGLNPSFYMDDSPEIITSAATLGLAHPPGYPLYTLLGRLASLLPLGPVCLRVNLLAGLMGAATCCLLYFTLSRRFQLGLTLAWPFALLWMAGASAYPACLSAKNGLYQLTAALLLGIWASLFRGRHRFVFFLIGLSLCNHWMSMVVYGVGVAYFLWFHFQERNLGAKEWIRNAAFLTLGLSLYLYLPLRSNLEPLVNWGHPAGAKSFLMDITRHAYQGRDFSTDPLLWGKQGLYYFRSAFLEFAGVALLSLLGFYALWKTRPRQAWGLLLSWSGLLFAVCVFSKYSSERPYLMENYSISSFVLLPLLAGVGFQYLLSLLAPRNPSFAKTGPFLALGLTLFLVVLRVTLGSQAYYTYTYDYVLNAWKSVPKDGLFFCKGDVLDFPSWYLQMIGNKRPDLPVLGGGSLPMAWYRRFLGRTQPGLKVPAPSPDRGAELLGGHLIKWMVDQNPGRRAFFTYPDLNTDGLGDRQVIPNGLTQEGLPPATASPFDEVFAGRLWAEMRLRHFQKPDDSVDGVSWNYFLKDYGMARMWMALYWMRQAEGLPNEKAKVYYAKSLPHLLWVQAWDPENAHSALNVGLVYSGMGDTEKAMDWFKRATRIDPQYADAYYYAGFTAFQVNDRKLAKAFMEKALDINPGHAQARQVLQTIENSATPTVQ